MGLLMFREAQSASPKSALKSDPTASERSAIRRVPLWRFASPPGHPRRSSDGTQRRTALDAMGNLVELASLPSHSPLIRVLPPGYTNVRIVDPESEQRSPERLEQSNVQPDGPRDSTEDFLDAPEDVVGPHRAGSGSDSDGTRRRRRAIRRADSLERARLRHERRARRPDPSARFVVQPFSPDGGEEGLQRPEQPIAPHSQEVFADQARRFVPHGPYSGLSSSRQPDWRPISSDPPQLSRLRSHGEAVAPRLTIYNADGLGDRHRSLSPEENAWDTLLSTIQPDEHLPSASSSFVSAAASASSAPASQGSRTSSDQRSTQSSANSSATSLSSAASTTAAHISHHSSDPHALYICDDAADAVPPFSSNENVVISSSSNNNSNRGSFNNNDYGNSINDENVTTTTLNNNNNNNRSLPSPPPPPRDWTTQHYRGQQQRQQPDLSWRQFTTHLLNERARTQTLAPPGSALYWPESSHGSRSRPDGSSLDPPPFYSEERNVPTPPAVDHRAHSERVAYSPTIPR